jgi:hypothetical protein
MGSFRFLLERSPKRFGPRCFHDLLTSEVLLFLSFSSPHSDGVVFFDEALFDSRSSRHGAEECVKAP